MIYDRLNDMSDFIRVFEVWIELAVGDIDHLNVCTQLLVFLCSLETHLVIAAGDQINWFIDLTYCMADVPVHIIPKDTGIEKPASTVIHVS